jgi:rare lipoprotein A
MARLQWVRGAQCTVAAARRGWWLLVLPLLWSCSSMSVLQRQDGAPSGSIDVSKIPDAVPRVEPRSRYGNPRTYRVNGRVYHVRQSSRGYVARGIASWYGTKFHGRTTSSGEPYDMYAMTAAHRTLPLPTFVRVTNLNNGRSVVVKVNDRGPFVKNRLIDLSYAAAKKLGVVATGTAPVEVRAIDPRHPRQASATPAALHSPAPASAHRAQLYVQVGAFIDRVNAERLYQRLERMPLPRVQIQRGVSHERTIYRVRIGPLADVDEADRLSDALAHRGLTDTRIVVD